ncbi:phage portal protein [Maridesulfovibrio ferrireducens]|uniref:phage portal protein n=1 Tax=Maridesulfovibrio ferrireducens TaxID=246191 RepID=UPI001A1CC97F|nr:phage portal protein [Maridesulfovibrio ferrireducens]MBI9110282.1 phage portal protein [Maridesulfovibrio ferrireducens]
MKFFSRAKKVQPDHRNTRRKYFSTPRRAYRVKNSSGRTLTEDQAIDYFARSLGFPTATGNMVSRETAMRVSTVYRCVGLIAGTIASLPCQVFRQFADDKKELALKHPAYKLLNSEPSPMLTANTFWKSFIWYALMGGNGYSLIGRNSSIPTSINLLPDTCVNPRFSDDYSRILYSINQQGKNSLVYDQDDVIHYPFIGFDGLKGRSPLECARESVGIAQAGEEYNGLYFKQGVGSNVGIEYPSKFDGEQAKFLRDTVEKQMAGMSNMHMPLVTMGGGKIVKLALSAEDSQLIESRMFQVEDICRFFGVPPHMVGHTTKTTSWGKGIEEQSLGFVKFTLRDILKGLEQEVNRKIIRSNEYYCKFNLDALLRADSQGRANFYKAALGGNQLPGYMTVNEVRKLENLSPIEGGGDLYIPVAGASGEPEEELDPSDPRRWAEPEK